MIQVIVTLHIQPESLPPLGKAVENLQLLFSDLD